MAQGNIEIRFRPKGSKALITAVKNLDVATKRLQGQTSIYEKELRRMGLTQVQVNKFLKQGTNNLRIQTGAFATLRSNLLLYSFALGIAQRGVVSFVEQAAKIEDLEKGFASLTRTIGGSSESLLKLEKATNNTVKQADLFRQANNAMMLGVVKTDDEMAELFDTAQRLGRALGKDTVSSIESLVTGMGRQSRLMLDNLGIIVDSNKAYENYAEQIGTTVSALTDSQKKTAFNNEAMRQAKKIVDALGKEQVSTTDTIESMNKSINDISIEIGIALIPVLELMAKSLKLIADNLDAELIQKYTVSVTGLAVAYGVLSGAIKAAIVSTGRFLVKNVALLAVFVGAGALLKVIDKYTDLFEKLGIVTDDLSDSTANYLNNLAKQSKEEQKRSVKVKELNDLLNINNQQVKIHNLETGKSNTLAEKQAILNNKREMHNKKVAEDLFILNEAEIANNEIIIEQMQLNQEITNQKIENAFKVANAIQSLANQSVAASQAELNADKARELQAANSIRSERRRAREIEKINEKFAEKQKSLNEKSKQAKRTQTVINTATSIMEVFADKELGAFAKIAMYGLVTALGASQLKAIDAAKYEYGGLVGGRRHSQGGTMIEAERGEYVVSRRGVDAVGIEALNRINAGGTGGVNVSINNPILSKDVVEDDLIPQIKEAIRRGADIGVG